MKKINFYTVASYVFFSFSSVSLNAADSITEAFTSGKVSGNFRLRHERVKQDNALQNATGLTLRSRLGYKTADLNGFSAQIEFEDSRVVLGQDNYNDTNGNNAGVYSVIADPETTEVDQFNLQYKNKNVHVIAGRQVFTLGLQRHIGHVGWRQDRQTFDGVTVKASVGDVSATLAKLESRNRIFAEAKDIDSDDLLIDLGYKTPYGELKAYYHALSDDTVADKASDIDTKGLGFSGKTSLGKMKVLYAAEYAKQEQGGAQDVNYQMFELGARVKNVTAKIGHEVLGSNGTVGFATPLATLHKFNGWSDQFLVTPTAGLKDSYISLSGKLKGSKLVVAYHDFSADETTLAADEIGTELNILYVKKFGKNYSAGAKFAKFTAGDESAGKVDTEKSWIWLAAKF